jgi:hypothetical protein
MKLFELAFSGPTAQSCDEGATVLFLQQKFRFRLRVDWSREPTVSSGAEPFKSTRQPEVLLVQEDLRPPTLGIRNFSAPIWCAPRELDCPTMAVPTAPSRAAQ